MWMLWGYHMTLCPTKIILLKNEKIVLILGIILQKHLFQSFFLPHKKTEQFSDERRTSALRSKLSVKV